MVGTFPDFSRETQLGNNVAGIDEAGRAPLAGPVVAAAVILSPDHVPDGINDSKKLSVKKREQLFEEIKDSAIAYSIALASVNEIDDINILHASMLAMQRAVSTLPSPASYALIDGNRLPPDLPCPGEPIVKGDSRSLSIAAASILAKVTRDRIMAELSQDFPYYGWERNAGYPVKYHLEALRIHGVTQHHRRSFRPVRDALGKYELDAA